MPQVAVNQATASDRSIHANVWLIAGLGTVLCLIMAIPLLRGQVYAADDLGAYHLPLRQFYAQRLQAGEPFDWLPGLHSGLYLTGEGQLGTYHPWHLLLYRWLPLEWAFGLELLANYPVMALGMFFFLRRHLRADCAALGAVAFAFSGFNLLHFVHLNAMSVVALMPWQLWAITAWRQTPKGGTKYWGWCVLLTAFAGLSGYPQYVWFSFIAEALLVLVLVRWPADGVTAGWRAAARTAPQPSAEPTQPWSAAIPFACAWISAKVIGAVVAGIQLLPTMDALALSARSTDASQAYYGAMSPVQWLQLVAPYFWPSRVYGSNTHELGCYLGAGVLVLAAIAVKNLKSTCACQPVAVWAVAVSLLAIILSLGAAGGLYHLQTYLPGVGSFRLPCRYWLLVALGGSVVAAVSLERLLSRDPETTNAPATAHKARMSFMPWVLVTFAGLIAIAGMATQQSLTPARLLALAAGPLLFVLAACSLLALHARHRWGMACVALTLMFDQGMYGLSYAVFSNNHNLRELVPQVPPTLAQQPPGKWLADVRLASAPATQWDNRTLLARGLRADGYLGLAPRHRLEYANLQGLRAAGVAWVKRSAEADRIPGLIVHDNNWLQVPDPLPLVRLVPQTAFTSQENANLASLDVDHVALVHVPQGQARPAVQQTGRGELSQVSTTAGTLMANVHAINEPLLVWACSFHPGFKASIDGQPAPVWRVNGDFIGVAVPAGDHRVRISFEPDSLRYGAICTCLGGLIFVGTLLWQSRRAWHGIHNLRLQHIQPHRA